MKYGCNERPFQVAVRLLQGRQLNILNLVQFLDSTYELQSNLVFTVRRLQGVIFTIRNVNLSEYEIIKGHLSFTAKNCGTQRHLKNSAQLAN